MRYIEEFRDARIAQALVAKIEKEVLPSRDYHLMELALMLLREARGESYLTFFRCAQDHPERP